MDGRSSPHDHRHVAETNSFHSPTIQRQPSLRDQERSETQIPFVSSTESPLHHTFPAPLVSSRPPVWQLGRHSQIKSGIDYDRKSPGYPGGDESGKWDFERVQHQVDKFDESKLVDVEGDLQRGLKARQISMMALGGAIGVGLVIGTGTALRQGGPLGIFLGYSFLGLICYCLMQSIGEMTTYLPHKKGFAGYTSRFWHPAVGFALGWNYLFTWVIVCANIICTATVVIQFWDSEGKFPKAAWMTMMIILILCLNLLPIRIFGELEFWLSSVKVLTLIGLILFGIIVDLGGNPQHDTIGFRYWKNPGPMGEYLEETVGDVSLATFLGFWSVMVNALYAYIGIELIGVTVGEAENPRRNIPKAIRRTFFRISVFYVGGVFVIGLIVPSNAPVFVGGEAANGVAASPFVQAAEALNARGLVHVFNAALLVFIISGANTDLYIGSRTLYGLAVLNQAPRIFRKVTKWGVPVWALLFCWLFTFLVFMNLGEGPQDVFKYLVSTSVTFGGITWMCIFYTHIRFMKGLAAQGLSRDDLPYKAKFQPWASWFGLIATGIIMLFKGFDTFIHGNNKDFKGADFVAAYIGFPVFFLFAAFWKWKEGDETVPYAKIDLFSGKKEIDEEEKAYLEAQQLLGPRPKWKKIWDAL